MKLYFLKAITGNFRRDANIKSAMASTGAALDSPDLMYAQLSTQFILKKL